MARRSPCASRPSPTPRHSQRFLVQILLQLKGAGYVTSIAELPAGSSWRKHLKRFPSPTSSHTIDGRPPARPASSASAVRNLSKPSGRVEEVQAEESACSAELTSTSWSPRPAIQRLGRTRSEFVSCHGQLSVASHF